MSQLQMLRSVSVSTPVVGIVGGAVAGSETAAACAKLGAIVVVFEQKPRPYGKIEDGLPRWHVKLRQQEYERINENLSHERILFVPNTEIGTHLSFAELQSLPLSTLILANGAWNDRPLPVPHAEQFVGRGLAYQNPFVQWFNRSVEKDYVGPQYEIVDRSIVIGGGLASIDVVKIINLELYRKALAQRGIEIDVVELEVKGIAPILEQHGIKPEELGVEGCCLYYRRRKEDMPLASASSDDPKEIAKIENARVKIMDRVMRKYLVRFAPLHRPEAILVDADRVSGVRFQRADNAESLDIASPFVVSSIGSIPKSIAGIPMKKELYDFADWNSGEVRGLRGVFGLGNVLTGKGNIRDSRQNAIELTEKVIAAYLGVGNREILKTVSYSNPAADAQANQALQGKAMEPDQIQKLAASVEQRWREIGYIDYATWIAAHPPT